MLWQIHRLGKQINNTKRLKYCERCRLHYEPVLPDECPRCTGLSNEEVEHLIQKRNKARLTIGRSMFIGSLILIVLLILVNLVI